MHSSTYKLALCMQRPVPEWDSKDVQAWAKSINLPKYMCKKMRPLDGPARFCSRMSFLRLGFKAGFASEPHRSHRIPINGLVMFAGLQSCDIKTIVMSVQALLRMDESRLMSMFQTRPDSAYGTLFASQLQRLREVRPTLMISG